MDEAQCVPKRRKCAATTREMILESARARFLAESYDSVGMRDIARDAGVDVALVSRYFGSKEELFRLVLRGGEEAKFTLPADAGALAPFFLSLVSQGEDADCTYQRDKLMIMLRSAASPAATEVIRKSFARDVLEPLAGTIGEPNAQAKAMLVMAMLIGTNFLKTVMPVEPLSPEDQHHFRSELLRMFEIALAP